MPVLVNDHWLLLLMSLVGDAGLSERSLSSVADVTGWWSWSLWSIAVAHCCCYWLVMLVFVNDRWLLLLMSLAGDAGLCERLLSPIAAVTGCWCWSLCTFSENWNDVGSLKLNWSSSSALLKWILTWFYLYYSLIVDLQSDNASVWWNINDLVIFIGIPLKRATTSQR